MTRTADRIVTVGFDCDDVIVPWYDTAHELSAKAGITHGVTPVTWTPWEEYGCEKDDWVAVIDAAAVSGILYQAAPFPGVVEAMGRLSLPGVQFRIPIVTARGFWAHGEIVRHHTMVQLAAGAVPHDSVTFSHDKTAVRPMDYFLEDNVNNHIALEGSGVKAFLIDRPWNRAYETPFRVFTVVEYVAAVLQEVSDQ